MKLRTRVYVDGFNLYYGALKGTPFRWLDLVALARKSLSAKNEITRLNYYTARVSSKVKADSPAKQQAYLAALASSELVKIHLGNFVARTRRLPEHPIPEAGPKFVEVLWSEEKGSDVNLASHLVFDGCKGNFDVAVVISNDTDLIEPIRLVTELGKPVGLLTHASRPAEKLGEVASFVRNIKRAHLRACQLENPTGGAHKPAKWCLQDPIFEAVIGGKTGDLARAIDLLLAELNEDRFLELFGKPPKWVANAYGKIRSLAERKRARLLDPDERKQALEALEALARAAQSR